MSAPFVQPDSHSPHRTRIKLCGFTRDEDVDTAVELGIDAIGFVFYRPSPRYVAPGRAAALIARLPKSVAAVGLFVDASRDEIRSVLDVVPLTVLQFHGDEEPDACDGFERPHIKAIRVTAEVDLLESARTHSRAFAVLLDAHSAGYGGAGKVFDWSLVPERLIGRRSERPVILSGGLHAGNVADAIARIRPFAVDTSSGIETPGGRRA